MLPLSSSFPSLPLHHHLHTTALPPPPLPRSHSLHLPKLKVAHELVRVSKLRSVGGEGGRSKG